MLGAECDLNLMLVRAFCGLIEKPRQEYEFAVVKRHYAAG